MSEAVIRVRIDKETKIAVEKLYQNMDLTFPTAVRLFAKQSLVEQGLPFNISTKPQKAGGILNKYADINKMSEEKNAMEKEIIDGYNKNS